MENKVYDVVIIGTGVAGMNTALYCARNQLSVLIIDKNIHGGALLETAEVENYLGFSKVSGEDLAEKMMSQVLSYSNVEYLPFTEAKEIIKANRLFTVKTGKTKEHVAKTVVLAMGVKHKKLQVKGEQDLAGKGVVYCTECDKLFFKDKDVVVVGGGNTAVESAITMADIAKSVRLIHRRDRLRAEKLLVGRMLNKDNVEVLYDMEVARVLGEDKVTGILVEAKYDTGFSNLVRLDTDAVFVNIGVEPSQTDSLLQYIDIYKHEGYIVTTSEMSTSVDGVFAVGDIRKNSIRQISTAVGDGAIAATTISKYLEKLEAIGL